MLAGTAAALGVQGDPGGVVGTVVAQRVHLRSNRWSPASTWTESGRQAEQVAVRVA